MLMAFSSHRQKIAAARMPTRTPNNGLETANQKEMRQPDSLPDGFVFTLFSQAFEGRHFTEREISFGTLNELRRIWIVASGLEDPRKTPPGYDRITIFAQVAQATHIVQAKLRHLPLCLFRDEAPPLLEIEA
jgi:hypothetical protein